jgi:phosphohistidine phosphatase
MVVLMRHGDAMSEAEDPKRSLSVIGREHAKQVSGRLAGLDLGLAEIRHSGKERARQTAEILAAQIGISLDRVTEVSGLKPNDDVEIIAEALEVEGCSVALVGHLPFMGRLASRLLSGDASRVSFRFEDAGCLIVSRDTGAWRLDGFINHDLLG